MNHTRPGDCFYNSCVMCDEKNKCAVCGWNPKVTALRKAMLKSFGNYLMKRGEINGKTKDRGCNGKKNS